MLLAAPALGQHAKHHGGSKTTRAQATDLHRPKLWLAPEIAFDHLRKGAFLVQRARMRETKEARIGSPHPRKFDAPTPARRPTGAGKYLAAVVSCADADLDVPATLLQRRRDLLLFSSPGPRFGRDEVGLLEHSVREHGLSLCVVLVHEGCETLQRDPRRANGSSTEGRTSIAPEDHGVALARHILRSSETCEQLRQRGKFQVVTGVVSKSGDVRWIARWADRPALGRIYDEPAEPEPEVHRAKPTKSHAEPKPQKKPTHRQTHAHRPKRHSGH